MNKVNSHIIEVRIGYIVIVLSQQSEESFLGSLLNDGAEIDLDNPNSFLPNFDPNRWRQKGCEVVFHSPYGEIQFTVPEDFVLYRTSSDYFTPLNMSYFLRGMMSTWSNGFQLEARAKSWLSFSGGVDSTAAMCLMPENTVNFYLERNFKAISIKMLIDSSVTGFCWCTNHNCQV